MATPVDWQSLPSTLGRRYNNIMPEENQKPLTLDELAKYNQEVLLPAFDAKINKLVTKDELRNEISGLKNILITKQEFNEFKDKTLTNFDVMLKKLDILLEDKEIRQYQKEKERKLFAIMIKAMKEHNVLSPKDLEEIARLEIF